MVEQRRWVSGLYLFLIYYREAQQFILITGSNTNARLKTALSVYMYNELFGDFHQPRGGD